MSQKPDYIDTRSFLAANVDVLLENLSARKQAGKIDADDLFGDSNEEDRQAVPWQRNFKQISKLRILIAEKESLGLYVSGNPLTDYLELQKWAREVTLRDDIYLMIINKSKKIFTKTNAMMFALQISTTEEELEAIIFPKIAMDLSPKIEEKEIFWVKGRISRSKKSQAKAKEDAAIAENLPEVETTTNIDDEISGENAEMVTDTGPAAVEEIKEYDELPKLLVSWMVPFSEGVLPLFANEEIKLAVNRIKKLESVNWLELKTNPNAFSQYLDERPKSASKDDKTNQPHQADSNDTAAKNLNDSEDKSNSDSTPVYLSKSLGSAKLKEVREHLRTAPGPNLIAVEVWVENGEGFKKAKGAFWLDENLALQYNTK